MKKEEFFIDSRDNVTKLHALRWTPDSGNVVAVVQIVHGMSEHVERYEKLAKFLTDMNMVVTGEDHLGHGKSVPENGIWGYFCEQDPATVVVRDVHRLKKVTQEMYPGVPYFILGHSLGAFILRNYMCRYGTGIDGAIIMGSGVQPAGLLSNAKLIAKMVKLLKGSKQTSPLLQKLAFGSYNKRVDNPETEWDWLSCDKEEVAAYIADEDCGFGFTVNGFQTMFELIAGAQKKENLEKVPDELPILVVSGTQDPVGGYGEGVKKMHRLLEDAGLQDVTLKLYEGSRHELLNETNRMQVMEDIANWVTKHLAIQV